MIELLKICSSNTNLMANGRGADRDRKVSTSIGLFPFSSELLDQSDSLRVTQSGNEWSRVLFGSHFPSRSKEGG
jgi:hypothetical protein